MGDIIVSGAAARKAGSGVSTDIPEDAWTEWISGAESFINDETRTNWSGIYATTDSSKKSMVADTCASMVAMNAISYDMSGYLSVQEATTLLDVYNDQIRRNITILKTDTNKTFIGVT